MLARCSWLRELKINVIMGAERALVELVRSLEMLEVLHLGGCGDEVSGLREALRRKRMRDIRLGGVEVQKLEMIGIVEDALQYLEWVGMGRGSTGLEEVLVILAVRGTKRLKGILVDEALRRESGFEDEARECRVLRLLGRVKMRVPGLNMGTGPMRF